MTLLTMSPSNFETLIGRLHPLVVHLPIGILLLLALFEFLGRNEKYAVLRPAIVQMAFWGMISAIFSCIAGYILSKSGGYDKDLLAWHKWFGIAIAVLTTAFYVFKKIGIEPKFFGLISCFIFTIILSITGHFGGALTHGEDYLTQPFLAMIGAAPVKVVRQPITNINEAFVYKDIIEPVLEQKCMQCHNSQKQKGNLRIDTPELLLKGGKHGKIIIAGNTQESEFYKRLLLPEEDEHRMPPKGKTQLSKQELVLIEWWIQTGASMNKKVASLPKNGNIKTILASLQGGAGSQEINENGKEVSEFLEEKVPNSASKDIESLSKINIIVDVLSPKNGWVSINTVNNTRFNDAQISLLLPLKSQIVWLNLGDSQITGTSLNTIGELSNMTRLNLENTAISDAGLQNLSKLKHLQYLNLVNTHISNAGLETLKEIKSLKKVYLWQSKVNLVGVESLRKALPNCEINVGEELIINKPIESK